MPSDLATRVAAVGIAAVLIGGCIKPPRQEPEVNAVARPVAITPFPSPTQPRATATPTAAETPSPTATLTPPPLAAQTFVEAPSLVEKINGSTPPNVAAALRLVEDGRALLAQQAYERALDRFERALAIDPSNAYGYYYLARLHFEQRSYDQAIAFADKSAVLSARDDKTLSARAYALQGTVFEQVGRFPDARTAYRRALAADGNNVAAQAGMARLGGNGTSP
ncbi:MAG TPA: tetratricopeptide repeat protein [Candidatus Kryptonia bacterium]|nr:tetratricopeptide repeat protein [Candidatus Kryptonia bacterium]